MDLNKSNQWSSSQSSRGKYRYVGDTLVSLKLSVAWVKGSQYAKKPARSIQPFQYITGVHTMHDDSEYPH